MLSLRGLAPRNSFWREAQFDTIRLCLIKVAGRVTEMVTRIKVALQSAYPYQSGFATLAGRIATPAGVNDGARMPPVPNPPRCNLKPQSPASPTPLKIAAPMPPSDRNSRRLTNDPG